MSPFEYSITRPITLSRWAFALILVGVIVWSVLVTLISVAAVGYELIQLSSTDYNGTYSVWYDDFVRPVSGLIPKTWNCVPSIIKLNEGYPTSFQFIYEISVFFISRNYRLHVTWIS